MITRRLTHIVSSISLLLCAPTWAAQSYFAGNIVDANNQPLAGATVQAGHMDFPINGSFIVDGQATSDAAGNYSINTLAAGDGSGNYALVATLAGRVGEVYPEQFCRSDSPCPGALPPVVAVPNLSADFQLFLPSSISGHVTRSDTHAPVPGVYINITYLTQETFLTPATSDATGAFTFSGLVPGNYQLDAAPTGVTDVDLLSQVYAGHDYDFTLNYPDGDQVQLSEGQNATGIDFPLNLSGEIDGTTLSAINGDPLQAAIGIERLAPVSSGGFISDVLYSNGSYFGPNWGQYRITGLMPGTFHVQFGGGFAPQFYADASSDDQAQDIVVKGSKVVPRIDAHLTPLQTIAGTVRDAATNQPLAGILVHSGPIAFITLTDAVDALTDSNGNYLLQGLGPTSSGQFPDAYYIWIFSVPNYVDAFYPATATTNCCGVPPVDALAVSLDAGQTATGYDIAMTRGATISGRVYDPDTGYTPPAPLQIGLQDAQGNFVENEQTDNAGNYTGDAVPVGSYYVAAEFPNFSVYYPDYPCSTDCQLGNAQLLNFPAAENYVVDIAIKNLDLVFRGNFE